jgi:hypothetical protein
MAAACAGLRNLRSASPGPAQSPERHRTDPINYGAAGSCCFRASRHSSQIANTKHIIPGIAKDA